MRVLLRLCALRTWSALCRDRTEREATLGVPSGGTIDVHPLGGMLELLRVGAELPKVAQRGVCHGPGRRFTTAKPLKRMSPRETV